MRKIMQKKNIFYFFNNFLISIVTKLIIYVCTYIHIYVHRYGVHLHSLVCTHKGIEFLILSLINEYMCAQCSI